MATLDEIGTYLQTSGIGTLGSSLFIGMLPQTPDTCVAIYEYGGSVGTYTMGSTVSARLEYPRIQAIARAASYSTARAKIQSVYTTLDAVAETDLSSKRYHRIRAATPPIYIGKDESNRPMFSCNFETMKDV